MGFSYCQKPIKCPSKRFNDQCDPVSSSPACQNCIIGKAKNYKSSIRLNVIIIPTFIYVAKVILSEKRKDSGKNLIFLITACELSLKMFGDYASILRLNGVGVRLRGRICNTFPAFKFAEKGIKPGLTVLDETVDKDIRNLLAIIEKISD